MLEEQYDDKLQVTEETWGEKWKRVMNGLRAPHDSGEYKYAVMSLQRIFGPSSASTSITLVILLLLLFVKMNADNSPPALDVRMVDPEIQELEEIEDPPIEEPEPEIDPTTMEVGSELGDTSIENVVSTPSYGDNSSDEMVPVQAIDSATISPMVIKGLYGNRTGGGRASAIGRYGGGGSDTVVLRALRWLKANQLEDGSWAGAGSPTAMCGLALLCYMAHGETPASKEFGATVEKAIRYLLYAIDPATGRFKEAGSHFVYGHAIATYGLAEAYGMTKMVMLKEPLEKAVQVIIDGQQPGGAWDYDYNRNEGTRKDMSVTAWQVQALKAAKLAGAENEHLDDALYKAVEGVKSFSGGTGFGYTATGQSSTLSGAGALCLQLLGVAHEAVVGNTLKAFEDKLPAWEKGKDGYGTYGWYYMTQGRFQNGGPLWDTWNAAMLPMLTKNQIVEGNLGHWEHNSTHSACPVYDTTLCCLCLEVYYRYLPTYAKVDDTLQRPPSAKNEDDVKIAVDL